MDVDEDILTGRKVFRAVCHGDSEIVEVENEFLMLTGGIRFGVAFDSKRLPGNPKELTP